MELEPNRFVDYSNMLVVSAAILTVIGSIGVIYFGKKSADIKEAQLKAYQKDADERIAVSNAKAQQAILDAEQVRTDHKKLELLLSDARVEILRLSEKSASAKEDAMIAQIKANEAQLKLAEYTSKRFLLPELKNRLYLEANAFPSVKFSIFVSPDADSAELALQIEEVLVRGGWQYSKPSSTVLLADKFGMRTMKGIVLTVPVKLQTQLLPPATAIAKLLKEMTKDVEIRVVNKPDMFECADCVVINVGSKN